MTDISKAVLAIKEGKTRTVRGIVVKKQDGQYLVEGETFGFEDAVAHLKSLSISQPRGINYDKLAFLLFDGSQCKSTHRCRSREEHAKLVALAKSRNYTLYIARVVVFGSKYYAARPFVVDFDTVSDLPTKNKEHSMPHVSCPVCQKPMTSTSGRTLHLKAKHPNYKEESASEPEVKSESQPKLQKPSKSGFPCPICGKVLGSTSGRTNHMASQHADALVKS